MNFVPMLVILTVSLTILHHVNAISTAPTEMIPNEKNGCPDLNPLIRCIWFNQECDTETDQPCPASQICCPNECGSSCKVPTYIKPSPVKGCPPIDTRIQCIWFNEKCNETDKRCPAGYICCGDNCGTSCIKKC